MNIYLPIAEMSVDVFLILGLGGAIGFLSGLFGVGGGFLFLRRHSETVDRLVGDRLVRTDVDLPLQSGDQFVAVCGVVGLARHKSIVTDCAAAGRGTCTNPADQSISCSESRCVLCCGAGCVGGRLM